MTNTPHNEIRFLKDAQEQAEKALQEFGRHPSADFAVCRLTEEVGELAQAATAMSKGRHLNRRERMYDEAVDVLAMVLRLLREFPDGRTAPALPEEAVGMSDIDLTKAASNE